MARHLFTSESVTEGHPDKICDQISDAILDEILTHDPDARVACETCASTGLVHIMGEITTNCYVDFQKIVREVISDIGYTRAKYGFDADTCAVISNIDGQSPDIALGTNDQVGGAGDQGMMFGYACKETKTLMPMPIYLAQRMSERLAKVRKDGTLPYLRPDGKTQVSVRYVDGAPVNVEKVVVSTQHAEDIDNATLRRDVTEQVIKPVLADEGVELAEGAEIHINPTGRFVIGGPMGDCGLTGRKIIVDTYGGMGRHGGGAFSGKDCTKVDRSAAYAARWVAKNVVAADLADRCEIQVAYAIGVAKPVSIMVETFGTARPRGRYRACGERGLRPAPGRHHRRPRPASPHLSQDGRLWSLRPRASRVHLGEDRSRGCASRRVRPRLATLFRDSLSIPRAAFPPLQNREGGVLLKAAIRVVRPRCFRYT